MARQMLLQLQPFREYQARRIDVARCGLLAKVHFGRGIGPVQPQHAAIDPPQQSHPNVEDRRSDLVVVVETAEYEAADGEARLRTRRRPGRYGSLRIVDLVA